MDYFLIEIPLKTCAATNPVDHEGHFVELYGSGPKPWELCEALGVVRSLGSCGWGQRVVGGVNS